MTETFLFVFLFLIFNIFLERVKSIPEDETCFKEHYKKQKSEMNGDGGFEIRIRDMNGRMAYRFESGDNYKISIVNKDYGIIFKDFSLYTSLDIKEEMKMMGTKMSSPKCLGRLVIPKRYGIINKKCRNNVHGVDGQVHTRIEIIWQAPMNPIKCINFKVQIIKTLSMIFEDTGGLMKTFCPTKMYKILSEMDKNYKISEVAYEMPPMVKECCACGTASFNVTFMGLWSKKTHPTEWPKHKSMLHWTNLIGATHTGNYFIYHNGGQASQAVQSICSYGDNTVLKQNFASENVKANLKSYFHTPGMWNEDELTKNRSGLISVNRTHNLFTFLTMMGPSPDWCTGIAAVDLCTSECSWKNNLTFDLYPFDAGIKYGKTYMPLNSDRLDIPDPITIINTTIMKEYPFTPNVPVARIFIQRIKPKYNWQCTKMSAEGVEEFDKMISDSRTSDQSNENAFIKQRQIPNANSPLNDPSLAQMATFLCITSSWSLWSPCSVTCGIGSRSRSKTMIKNLKNELCRHVPLFETESCEGRQRACDFSAPCSVLSWSNWNPCNATCDKDGIQSRMRLFARLSETEACMFKMGMKVKLSEYRNCTKERSQCDPVTICSEGLVTGLKCGKVKTRFYYDAMKHACLNFKYLGCKGSLNNFAKKSQCENMCLKSVENLPQWRREKLAVLQYQLRSKNKDKRNKKSSKLARQCTLSVNYGSTICNSSKNESIRYYYDIRYLKCREFMYGGCGGNNNSFLSYDLCIKACMPDKAMEMASAPKRDCVYTLWSHWSHCSTSCGIGEYKRYRYVLKPSMNGGAPCPKLYEEQPCMMRPC